MKLGEFLKLINDSAMLRIVRNGADVYVGYLAMLRMLPTQETNELTRQPVSKFKAVPEIRLKNWKEKNRASPLTPDEMPEYQFADLMMTLYYTIHIGQEDNNEDDRSHEPEGRNWKDGNSNVNRLHSGAGAGEKGADG